MRSRYSDEQLYALATISIHCDRREIRTGLTRWPREDRGSSSEGCATCHTPPLYTNNKLTPADGFAVPPDHREKYDILPISVGTDPDSR